MGDIGQQESRLEIFAPVVSFAQMSGLPKLRSDLVSSSVEIDSNLVYTLKDPVRGTYFRLRAPEYWLVSQLDGQTTAGDVARRFSDHFGVSLSEAAVEQFITTLRGLHFLESSASEQVTSRMHRTSEGSLLGRLLFLKLKAFSPGRLLDWLTSLYRPFHTGWGAILLSTLLIVGLSLLVVNADSFAVRFHELFSLFSFGSILLAIFLVLGLHEFAHAVLCRFYGGQVREIGFLLLYFQPCFYCDISDAWLFPEKRKRLAVTLAGPMFQLAVMSVAIIIWRMTVPSTWLAEFSRIVVLVSWISLLFNFNPLIKLDGYYILSDWLEIPNLRSKSFAYAAWLVKRHLLGWQVESPDASSRERRIFLWYALLAGLFTTILLGSFLLWLGGEIFRLWGRPAFALFLIGLSSIFLPRIGRLASGLIRHRNDMKRFFQQPVRLAVISGLFAAITFLGIAIPFPQRVSGDVLVEPISVFSVAFTSQGLLEQSLAVGGQQPTRRTDFVMMSTSDMAALQLAPTVQNGQSVAVGDTVAVLSSNQISSQIVEAQAELDQLNGELALLQAKPKKERIDEARADVGAAKAQLTQLKKQRERTNELVSKKLESAEKLEEATAAYEVARSTLANKESTLRLLLSPPRPEEEAVIRSKVQQQEARLEFLRKQASAQVIMTPISGIAATGSDERTIVTVTSHAHVELIVTVSDYDIELIALDQPVQVMVRSFPGETFEGRVVRIPQAADSSGLQFGFPVTVLVENGQGRLKEGMTGYAKIETGRQHVIGQLGRKLLSFLRVEFWSWW